MQTKTAIVAAHPDDEVLWFSSLVTGAERIILCFLDIENRPDLTEGRHRSVEEHPLPSLRSLGIAESGAFTAVDWRVPVMTKHGMEILVKSAARRYRDNYYRLRYLLRERLSGCAEVVTHNPWGEYGHPEHVQVYRVVKDLQESLGFTLWFSNYCSTISLPLALQYIAGFSSAYTTLMTDKETGERIRDIYKRNGCWTWYDDWEWFNEESFTQDADRGAVKPYGHLFPLNMIKMNSFAAPVVRPARRFRRNRYLKAMKSLVEKL